MINNINSMITHEKYLNNTSHNIANINTNNFNPIKSEIVNESNLSSYQNNDNNEKSNKLFSNNVDLTNEITDMIIIQNGYEFNGKVIETYNEMFRNLINLKI